ncbi:MAG: ATP-binding cassette domain-containing protein [Planctomycetes bacterium]|jgi:putative ABC transport system ATP-binding protein|nr:ABC transporter ATP-binding protein [Phycisphaerae bacterium]NBB96410.1 ATP-binding cassette domain-containing protein [Planctomycetota bacterium]
MSLLEFDRVSMTFGEAPAARQVLTDVSLHVASGQALALMGTSGSGKTTLLNLAAGLARPTVGAVRLLGQKTSSTSEAALARRRGQAVGFVFQALNLLATLTAAENIELPMILNRFPRADRVARVTELLSRAGLAEKADALPASLSAGEQQRIAVLRAVAHRPQLVLMDEPTSCLDSDNSRALMDLVMEMNVTERTAVVMATHDPHMAAIFSNVLRLCDGAITA